MSTQSVVYICAHPDDIESVTGTLTLLRRKGYTIHDFCLTPGQRGYKLPGQTRRAGLIPPNSELAATRIKEEQAACAVIGAELTMFDEMDGELYAHRAICEKVAAKLAEIKPAAVITLWALEKPDHSAAFSIAYKALHLNELYWTTEFYMSRADGSGYHFRPDLYVNVSNVIEQKKAVAACYPSQLSGDPADYALRQARLHGQAASCDYAEGFSTSVPLVGTRWDRPAEIGRLLLGL